MIHAHISTPCRLHFGLIGWGPAIPRQFGGAGLMVRRPRVELTAKPGRAWEFHGPLAHRARAIVQNLLSATSTDSHFPGPILPASIQILTAPPEHVGLGVGTQLSLAVIRALMELAGTAEPTISQLAELSGRGKRSGIGLHGFSHGGFIVDGGRRDHPSPPPLLARAPFPESWSILLVRPPGHRGVHGPAEHEAFSRLPPFPERAIDRMCRLILLGLLPAVIEQDLPAFGAALTELQTLVGEAFAPIQGDRFASTRGDEIIAELRKLGLQGAGQSSWGPTLYAFGILSDSERTKTTSYLIKHLGLSPDAIDWTEADNQGARIARVSP